MPRFSRRLTAIAAVLLAGVFLLVTASVALGYPGLNSSVEKQAAPGLTQRTIYGSCQVFVYELPHSVSHIGYIHAELTYRPGDYDTYIYLIGPDGNICAFTEGQGYMGTYAGKESVDFWVPSIANQELTPYGDDVVGDTYYVMVQAFDDVSKFQISGYYPRIDLAYGNSTESEGNWYRQGFRFPRSKTAWKTIYGAPYGSPYDFTPTSLGSAWMQLRYPWDAAKKTPLPDYLDNTKRAANFDQYMYPSDWSEDGAIWDYDWAGNSHWAETSSHGGLPPVSLVPDPTWTRALNYKFAIESGAPKRPMRMLHYIPVLWMASSDATLGKSALKTGMSTVGYRADLLFPQNLYMKKPPSSVKAGNYVTLKGNLAIDPAWAGTPDSGAIAWAAAGTKVMVQRKIGNGAWKNLKATAVVGASGAWSARVKVTSTAKYRAVWKGSALRSISVVAQKTPVGMDAEDPITVGLGAGDAVFNDGSVDLAATALDPVAGVTLNTTWDTATYTSDGTAFTGATLKAGSPALEITMSDGTKVEVSFKSVDFYVERSLAKGVTAK